MPRSFRVLALLVLVAACARPGPPPAIPAATRPTDEVRAVETTGRTGLRVLGLTQGRVRACSGAYEPPTESSPVRSTELACTGGVSGTATVRPRDGNRYVEWSLETGERGTVRL